MLLKYFHLRKNMNDKSKELDKTKDELDKIKDEFNKYVHRKKPSKIKTSKAKSFEDQKRKRNR